MSTRNIYVDKDFNQNHLENAQVHETAATTFDGHEIRDAARRYVQLGGTQETYAFLSDLPAAPRQLVGSHDASTGLPTGTIEPGFEYVVSADGTIAGILGADALTAGDTLLFIGGAPANPADPAQWIGVQQNIDDAVIGSGDFERQTVALVAATPLTVTAATVADIHSVRVYDSAGEDITDGVCILKTANPNERVIEANQALTGVVVEFGGKL